MENPGDAIPSSMVFEFVLELTLGILHLRKLGLTRLSSSFLSSRGLCTLRIHMVQMSLKRPRKNHSGSGLIVRSPSRCGADCSACVAVSLSGWRWELD
jgi:hypothetical protein